MKTAPCGAGRGQERFPSPDAFPVGHGGSWGCGVWRWITPPWQPPPTAPGEACEMGEVVRLVSRAGLGVHAGWQRRGTEPRCRGHPTRLCFRPWKAPGHGAGREPRPQVHPAMITIGVPFACPSRAEPPRLEMWRPKLNSGSQPGPDGAWGGREWEAASSALTFRVTLAAPPPPQLPPLPLRPPLSSPPGTQVDDALVFVGPLGAAGCWHAVGVGGLSPRKPSALGVPAAPGLESKFPRLEKQCALMTEAGGRSLGRGCLSLPLGHPPSQPSGFSTPIEKRGVERGGPRRKEGGTAAPPPRKGAGSIPECRSCRRPGGGSAVPPTLEMCRGPPSQSRHGMWDCGVPRSAPSSQPHQKGQRGRELGEGAPGPPVRRARQPGWGDPPPATRVGCGERAGRGVPRGQPGGGGTGKAAPGRRGWGALGRLRPPSRVPGGCGGRRGPRGGAGRGPRGPAGFVCGGPASGRRQPGDKMAGPGGTRRRHAGRTVRGGRAPAPRPPPPRPASRTPAPRAPPPGRRLPAPSPARQLQKMAAKGAAAAPRSAPRTPCAPERPGPERRGDLRAGRGAAAQDLGGTPLALPPTRTPTPGALERRRRPGGPDPSWHADPARPHPSRCHPPRPHRPGSARVDVAGAKGTAGGRPRNAPQVGRCVSGPTAEPPEKREGPRAPRTSRCRAPTSAHGELSSPRSAPEPRGLPWPPWLALPGTPSPSSLLGRPTKRGPEGGGGLWNRNPLVTSVGSVASVVPPRGWTQGDGARVKLEALVLVAAPFSPFPLPTPVLEAGEANHGWENSSSLDKRPETQANRFGTGVSTPATPGTGAHKSLEKGMRPRRPPQISRWLSGRVRCTPGSSVLPASTPQRAPWKGQSFPLGRADAADQLGQGRGQRLRRSRRFLSFRSRRQPDQPAAALPDLAPGLPGSASVHRLLGWSSRAPPTCAALRVSGFPVGGISPSLGEGEAAVPAARVPRLASQPRKQALIVPITFVAGGYVYTYMYTEAAAVTAVSAAAASPAPPPASPLQQQQHLQASAAFSQLHRC
ncbi:collagen alpha-1(I) chain-like [Suncus etruscus]|uniref:collagen alpha-1(I) chain-like n=1 Tax=Suncus etruscus TaxID=109475 RepID=UPI00210F50E1|nr:collagen alpha-1(I) chain-like [Suncus etruscus]